MRLVSRETLKDAFWVVFLFVVVAMMTDQVDQGLPVRNESITIAVIGLAVVIAYVQLRKQVHVGVRGRRYDRDVLICGLIFSAGFLMGITRAFTVGWEWPDLGLLVPAALAISCFKALFRDAPRLNAKPATPDSPQR